MEDSILDETEEGPCFKFATILSDRPIQNFMYLLIILIFLENAQEVILSTMSFHLL